MLKQCCLYFLILTKRKEKKSIVTKHVKVTSLENRRRRSSIGTSVGEVDRLREGAFDVHAFLQVFQMTHMAKLTMAK